MRAFTLQVAEMEQGKSDLDENWLFQDHEETPEKSRSNGAIGYPGYDKLIYVSAFFLKLWFMHYLPESTK